MARRAVELGVNFIDTADSYGVGANEELLAEALYPYAAGVVIATKVERIDLLQLHRIDPTVPFQDQLGALAQLQSEGSRTRGCPRLLLRAINCLPSLAADGQWRPRLVCGVSRSVEHLQENVAAARMQLTAEQLDRLAGVGNS